MIRVLIVEDDGFIAKNIKKILIEFGFEVTQCVKSVKNALTSIKNNRPDVVLIDIELNGDKNGIYLAHEIDKCYNLPYIYLTSIKDEKIIIDASTTRYNTYLTKPILNKENLKSNILVAINKAKNSYFLEKLDNKYSYDYENMILYYDNEPILLSKNETALLNILIKNRNNNVKSDEIERYIWQNMPSANSALRNLVYSLRKKSKLNIVTIQGLGYKLII